MDKAREFWINIYSPYNQVFDCVAHTTLEKCDESKSTVVKEKCVHVIEKSAYDKAVEALKEYRDFFEMRIHWVAPIHRKQLTEIRNKSTETLRELGELNE